MEILLEQVGKRYKFEWIFKKMNYTFESGGRYAILGPNGSGKSTLLRILSGHLTPSKGTVDFKLDNKPVVSSAVYSHISYAAPYIELIEELTLKEVLSFHHKFKPFILNMTVDGVMDIINLPKTAINKEIRFFSSGMKQRVKLAMSILTKSSLILLDEPTTNLDKQGMDWYASLVEKYAGNRTFIIASNEERDYSFCDKNLDVLDYKPIRKK
ncbi:MAG: ABC-type multidrug transport system ATPase subunit [Maribacter sp.]|jgi:ABC-type multidrug transport system ATPase subunit